MGILTRFGDIMKSNVNALLDKAEDPAKMVDQTLRNLREDLAGVKKETAIVMADEKRAQRQLEECRAEINKLTAVTQNVLKAGNETDARVLIGRKQQFESKLVSLQSTYDVAHANAEKMRQMHDKLTNDIDALENKKDAIKAKVATAKAQERMNKMVAGIDSSGSLATFGRMEAKADKMLDAANAVADLNSGRDTSDDLVDKYSTGGATAVDDELNRMKAELGLG